MEEFIDPPKMSNQDYIDQYYAGLEQLEKMMKQKRNETRMKAFASFNEQGAGKTSGDKMRELEAELEKERLVQLELSKQVTVYQEQGANMIKDMRDQQISKDQLLKQMSKNKQSKTYLPSVYDKDGKVDVNKFRPSAADLIAMTPS